ncbi:MAG TPA: hypothetical protein VK480_04145, partial [Solirubrobacterales bacterium]|nr:hypothetical protein [Solirubrobacterales bacterium]
MLLSWLLFPLLLLALSLGCGLLVNRASGITLPSSLLAPVGFTVVVLVGEMCSITPWLADLAAPAAAALAIAGFLLGRTELRNGFERFALYAALGTFAVYAAPIVFSGEPTFAGYIKLDDTSTWLAITDRIAEAGRSLSGLEPSTYEATLSFNLGSGYPIGAFTPWAIGSTLLGRDAAWLFQPYMATMALLLALCLYQLAGEVIRRPPLRALVAFLAAQPALLFGYYLWGGIKEMVAAFLLALLAALLPAAAAPQLRSWRGTIPAALAIAAVFAALTPWSSLWLLPMLFLACLAVAVRGGGRALLGRIAAVGGVVLVVSLPWLLDAGLVPGQAGALTNPDELGNLIAPLSVWQGVGIWPVGDFRVHPPDSVATVVLIAVALLAAAIGVQRIWSRRALGAGAFVLGLVPTGAVLFAIASPWIGGKTLAIATAAVLFSACLGAAFLWERGLRVEGGVALGLIALGVLWSNALGYRDVLLAPFDKLSELEQISHRIEGEGPTLLTEFEPYGARHFLRKADPESASELRRRVVPLRTGLPLDTGATADIDEFALEGLLPYETLVLRRSPLASRPPLPFELIEAGDFFEVWQSNGSTPPIEHLSLQGSGSPSATPSCAEIERLAALPGTVRLAASSRPDPTVIPMSSLALPADWELGGDGGYVTPHSEGTASGSFEVGESGEYGIWLGGSSRGNVKVEIDGEEVGSA